MEFKDDFDLGDHEELIEEWMSIMKSMFEKNARLEPLNRGEGLALLILEHSDKDLSAGELSEKMHLSTGRMANLLKQLTDKGYVERSHDPLNRRRTLIALTNSGKEHVDSLFDAAKVQVISLLEKLGPDDSRELVRILTRLKSIKEEDCYEH